MKWLTCSMPLIVVLAITAPTRAALFHNANNHILTDTQAARMWLLHGIGFGSSYPYPDFANAWVAGLNMQAYEGYVDWRLPTVTSEGAAPLPMSGELGSLFNNLSTSYSNRDEWPFGLGATAYGGDMIFTDAVASPGRYWALSFGNGDYASVYVGYAYAWVGVMAVHSLSSTGLPGDFDLDDDVDGSDLLLWQRGGSPNATSASDLADWKNLYGAQLSPIAHEMVPEPASLALLMIAAGVNRLTRSRNGDKSTLGAPTASQA